jgi:hypothetical protein
MSSSTETAQAFFEYNPSPSATLPLDEIRSTGVTYFTAKRTLLRSNSSWWLQRVLRRTRLGCSLCHTLLTGAVI